MTQIIEIAKFNITYFYMLATATKSRSILEADSTDENDLSEISDFSGYALG